jgi:hypothetical protein
MKKHSSVFMLMARSTIYRVMGLLILMAVAEAGLFWLRLQQGAIDGNFSLEAIISESRLSWACAAFFLFVNVILSWGSYTISDAYTAARLSSSGKAVYLWQCIYNSLCYLLFWMVQILIGIGLCRVYEAMAPAEFVSNQTVFLAFYRSNFLHSFLPFEDTWVWVRNILLVVALGICSSRIPGKNRKIGIGSCFLIAATGVFFVQGIGEAVALIIAAIVCAVPAVVKALSKEVPDED